MRFLRGVLALAAAAAALIGFHEMRLGLLCPAKIELRGSEILDAPRNAPLWTALEGTIPLVGPWIIATEAGEPNRVLLPLAGAEDPSSAVAMVSVGDLDYARTLLELPGPIRIDGIARLPTPEEVRAVSSYCRSTDLSLHSGFRILDAGRRPGGFGAAVLLFVAGTFLAAWAFAAVAAASLPPAVLSPGPSREGEISLAPCPIAGAPLPEDARADVHRMLKEVWDRTA